MKLRSLIGTCLLLLALGGCKPSLPAGVLSESKMESVLYDFHLAQGLVEHAPRDYNQDYETIRYELHQSVFRKHGITQEEFDNSMAYYMSDMEKMADIYRHIADRLEREAEALGVAAGPRDVYAFLTAEGDTANVWADRILFAVRNSRHENFQMWSLECDSTWQAGDDLLWRFQLQQITNSYGPGDLYADLVVTYTNDSVRSRLSAVQDQQDVNLRIDNPGRWTPRSVSGHLFAPISREGNQARLYIAFAPSLIRFHKPLPEESPADSLAADSLAADSLAAGAADSLQRRLSPQELRDKQPIDRTIDIVKEKPYTAPKSGRKRFVQPRRK